MGVQETRYYVFNFGNSGNSSNVRVSKTGARVKASISVRSDIETSNIEELINFRDLFDNAINKFYELEHEEDAKAIKKD